jgi:hypothetical protein
MGRQPPNRKSAPSKSRATSAPPIARLPASMLHPEAPAPPPAPPGLLDALARAHAAAALVFAALGRPARRALRLAHTELRDAVAQETTRLRASLLDDQARYRKEGFLYIMGRRGLK